VGAALQMTFRTSVEDLATLPASDAEVAVIGRSNVGKSSLVNALAGRRELARTSKAPGRTRLLNVFDVALPRGGTGTLVDLPGYGYAKVSKVERDRWQARMERYVLEREPLVQVVALVDGEVGPTKLDQMTVAWLRWNDVPFTVVATKHDKVRSTARPKRKRELAEGLGMPAGDPVWVSAEKGVGVDRLRALVLGWLADAAGA
jgi:GTP-binding protein